MNYFFGIFMVFMIISLVVVLEIKLGFASAEFISEHKGISVDVIYKAFSATEEGFLLLVKKEWLSKPQHAAVGSCCLIGVICEGMLYVANVGDSRAVLGRLEEPNGEITAVQLSAEHNASIDSVRKELRTLHPDDSQIVVLKRNVWRVKGLIQVNFLCISLFLFVRL